MLILASEEKVITITNWHTEMNRVNWTLLMGTEVEQRSEDQCQGKVLLLCHGTQSHIQPFFKIYLWWYWDDLVSKVQYTPGGWNRLLKPAQAFYGPPTISVPYFLIEASTHDQEQFVLP